MTTRRPTPPHITLHWQGSTPSTRAWLRGRLRTVLGELGVNTGLWHIMMVPDSRMRALHKQTLGLAATTDVLTFDLRDIQDAPGLGPDREGAPIEVDTVICVDEARRRAAELGHPLRAEVLLYALHSLLHVQGYDDGTPAQARRMHRREDEILIRLGIGAVYAGKASIMSKPGVRRAASLGKASSRDRHS
jgi:probable rRNA maturation factor